MAFTTMTRTHEVGNGKSRSFKKTELNMAMATMDVYTQYIHNNHQGNKQVIVIYMKLADI